mmetsp:Transcript_26366/g.56044  ORF Transcript_26366/g.56044 Transcript_26366/m.56044 type:complete len:357 (+) Transcript_26366:146-1216(+)|eukprot:CAMPEP_0172554530 /NCGR_PEP_ID=MMETSP1067-20121228/55064_1 /TAXON_ID=265564 ORGANISM="Thalassiosira punctigera, Strain Tpunct2005C2" /NCGR_SAMPLE_ID=MMETSP1067 /ASSEMBLY_ACC=CAM_ASM_000444 /LENGTH=356 /DNA_ID=CAMNT_0013342923 /DNA_START=89 /DNA_END=1159 /DNA_ORIENTATION=-
MAFGSMASVFKRVASIVKSNTSSPSRFTSTLSLPPSTFASWKMSRPYLKSCSAVEIHRPRQILLRGNGRYSGGSTPSRCSFSNRSSWEIEYEGLIAQRNKNIIMHPDGHSQKILPGNFVVKKNPSTGVEKKVLLEHALGYFWAIKELSLTDKKPILSNETLIPAAEAENFPSLKELVNLHEEVVDVPDFFTRNNRSKDANAQCTLVAISCKDFGARLLPSWVEPFDKAFRYGKDADRFEVVRITISEGRIAKLLSPFIVSGTKKKVQEKDHKNTLLYYGDAEEMRDILRMHNIYTGYVYLVDGIGRVRWAGSGEGSDEEVQSMIMFAKELTRPSERVAHKKLPSQSRVGRKVPRPD